MGICYQCKIRCFKVKDISQVDLEVFDCELQDDWRQKLNEYRFNSKLNIEKTLATYEHDPSAKRGHIITRILVPAETNVIAFGNDACDRYDMINTYEVAFFNSKRKRIHSIVQLSEIERNNFMVLVPEKTHYINYSINFDTDEADDDYYFDKVHDFRFRQNCFHCDRYVHTPPELEDICDTCSDTCKLQ